jgi:hypothetical protein
VDAADRPFAGVRPVRLEDVPTAVRAFDSLSAKASMNPAMILLLTIAATGAAGLAAWAWFAVANLVDEVRAFEDLEGMHFEG